MSKHRIVLLFITIILCIASLSIGARSDVNLITLLQGNPDAWRVLWISRLPRTLTVVLTASALSIAGLLMQSMSRNKFISPSTAGTTQAAMLGVLMSYIWMPKSVIWVQFIFAFVFSMAATLTFVFILNRIKFKNIVYVPLIGMMFGAFLGSLSQFVAYSFDAQQFLATLGVGSFTNKTIGNYELIYVVIPAIFLAMIYAAKFNIVALGPEFSNNLGVNYQRVMTLGLIIVSLIASSAFIVAGPIPFVGLVVPNLVSIYFGDNIKKNMLDLMLFGICFVLVNDLLARLILFFITGRHYELSVGFMIGIVGSIIFTWLIFRRVPHEKS